MTRDELLDGAGCILKAVEAIKVEFAKRAIEHELARRASRDNGQPHDAARWELKAEELRQALLIVEKYFPTEDK